MDKKQEKIKMDNVTILETAQKCVDRLTQELNAISFVMEKEDDELKDVLMLARCVSFMCIVEPQCSHLFVPPLCSIIKKKAAPQRFKETYLQMFAHDAKVVQQRDKDAECTYEYSQRNHADVLLHVYQNMVKGKVDTAKIEEELKDVRKVVKTEREGIYKDVAERLENARKVVQTLSVRPKPSGVN